MECRRKTSENTMQGALILALNKKPLRVLDSPISQAKHTVSKYIKIEEKVEAMSKYP